MTNRPRGRAVAFLSRAGLLLGMLAIIAGILGMHVMTNSHSMHAAAAATATDTVSQDATRPVTVQHTVAKQEPASPHTGHSTARTTAASSGMDSTPAPSCAGSGACTAMSAMGAACVPAPGNASLAAPLPDSTPLAVQGLVDAAAARASYNYLPGSPSPGELCISRT